LPAIVQYQTKKLDFLLERISSIDNALNRPTISKRDGVIRSAHAPATNNLTSIQYYHTHPSNPPLLLLEGSTSPSLYLKIVELSLDEIETHQAGPDINSDYRAVEPFISFTVLLDKIIHDGYNKKGDRNDIDGSDTNDPYLQRLQPSPARRTLNESLLSPLENIQVSEAERLVIVFDDIVGLMFPLLDTTHLIQTIRKVYQGSSGKHNLGEPWVQEGITVLSVDKMDISILKMVLAVALVAEGSKENEMSLKLYKSVQDEVEMKLWSSETDVKGLILLSLVVRAQFRLQCHVLLAYHSNDHLLVFVPYNERQMASRLACSG
jgi:hypothetical protein